MWDDDVSNSSNFINIQLQNVFPRHAINYSSRYDKPELIIRTHYQNSLSDYVSDWYRLRPLTSNIS